MKNQLKSRKGIVALSIEFIENPKEDVLSRFFSVFYPISVKPPINGFEYTYEYCGFSNYFDEVEDGCVIPQYIFEFHQDGAIKCNKIE